MVNSFKKSDAKKKQKNSNSTISSILNILQVGPFNHEDIFPEWVAEHNANLFNVPIKTAFETVNNFLVTTDFYDTNWLSLKKRSRIGVSAYVIFAVQSKLFFQLINLSNRIYDVTGKLVEATVFYEPYTKNNTEVLLYETYRFVNEKVQINRFFNEIKDNQEIKKIADKDFSQYLLNSNLKQSQTLNIDYLPIVIMKNKPDETSDCYLAEDKIATLNIFFEQIILDIVVNSPKFLFLNTYGNQQALIDEAVRNLVEKSYFFTDDPKNIEILEGSFKGKTLTDVVDWMINEISKRIFLYIPSQKKSAQQTEGEAGSVNIGTVNSVEQRIMLYKAQIFQFLKILISFDQDILKNKTFGINEKITLENLKLEMDIINTKTNQLEGEADAKRRNNIS